MSRSSLTKKERHYTLVENIKKDPFLTDEEIASKLSVSVPTIRLDRLELGIPELRERIKIVTVRNYYKGEITLDSNEIAGCLIYTVSESEYLLETTEE